MAEKISNNIRRLRFEANEMTQDELAKAVECSRQTINALEKGKYTPSLALAFRLSRVFHVTVEDVFKYTP